MMIELEKLLGIVYPTEINSESIRQNTLKEFQKFFNNAYLESIKSKSFNCKRSWDYKTLDREQLAKLAKGKLNELDLLLLQEMENGDVLQRRTYE